MRPRVMNILATLALSLALLLATVVPGHAAPLDNLSELSEVAPGFSAPSDNPAGPSQPGNKYAPNTVAPEQDNEHVNEADSARKARSVKAGMMSANATTLSASADGRVYNVLNTVNIRSCPKTSCSIVRVAYTGADLENDGSGGSVNADGYKWLRFTYGYGSTDPCSTSELKGWAIADPLAPGRPHVTQGPLNIRPFPCSGNPLTTVPAGTTLSFYQDDSQWSQKWYEIAVPGSLPGGRSGWVDGWDFTDVY